MKDLAPYVYRQRLVVEGKCDKVISNKDIEEYLSQLSEVLKMKTLAPPVTHMAEEFWRAGRIHWSTSGAHFYAWDKPTPFFSVDMYTCKEFKTEDAVEFTKKFFNTTEIAFKEI